MSDTSPLRALQAIDRVDLLQTMYGRVFVPPTVQAELAIQTPFVGAFHVADFPFLVVQGPRDATRTLSFLSEVDRGEAEALALALELHADAVLMDESIGRRLAASLGLRAVASSPFSWKRRNEGWSSALGH